MEAAFVSLEILSLIDTRHSPGNKKEKSVVHFYSTLKDLAENFIFKYCEETIIRDIFFTNIPDINIQRYLFRETSEPSQTLQMAINMEMGEIDQKRINSMTPVLFNSVQNKSGFHPANRQQQLTNTISTKANQSNQCRNCGQTWQPNQKNNCIALWKKCNNCGIMNHFAKMCRKPKQKNQNRDIKNMKMKPMKKQWTA